MAGAFPAGAHTRPRPLELAGQAYLAIDSDGVVSEWNAQAERAFGWTRGEIVGRRLEETILAAGIGQPRLSAIGGLVAGGEGPATARCVVLAAAHRDGRVLPAELVLWTSGRGEGAIRHAFLRDVTLESSAAIVAREVESLTAVISQDRVGKIVAWSPGAMRTYGYSAEEAIGRHISLIVPSGRMEEMERLAERVRRGERVVRHYGAHRARDGSEIEVWLTVAPVYEAAGNVIGSVAIAEDLTERRWMASTLDATLDSLQEALDQAREAEARSRRFLADAAHQLRAPLGAIRACAESLRRSGAGERERLLGHVVAESARAGRLVRSLLTLASLDQGRTLAPTSCDMVALCRQEADRALALSPHLEVAVQVVDERAAEPELDRHAVGEILEVLLDNARRHARQQIEVLISAGEGWVELRVCDDGPGMAEEQVEQAFERFASLDGKGGSGLGLPIARCLAQAHGGDLTYEQHTFVVRLAAGAAVAAKARDGPES